MTVKQHNTSRQDRSQRKQQPEEECPLTLTAHPASLESFRLSNQTLFSLLLGPNQRHRRIYADMYSPPSNDGTDPFCGKVINCPRVLRKGQGRITEHVPFETIRRLLG